MNLPTFLRFALSVTGLTGVLIAGSCSTTDAGVGSPAATSARAPFGLTADPVKAAGEAGVRMLGSEGTKVHYHAHLDVNVNGNGITVPAYIGIAHSSISELHTHDTTGKIHIEADNASQFTLQQLMTEWGARFDINCIETYCSDGANELRVYVDGQQVPDPTKVVFRDNQEIYVWFGPRSAQPSVPASWSDAAGAAPAAPK